MQPATPDTPKEQNSPPISITYGNNKPQNGLTFEASSETNDNGFSQIAILGNSIHSPRVYLDGQVYWIDYDTEGNSSNDPAIPGAYPMSITAHLRDDFSIPETPVWSDIAPIMIQFANLYPIMSKYFINFADPEAVIAKKEILKFAFTRDFNDPIYMPVTRDLSENKRLTILKWLDNPIIERPGLSDTKASVKRIAEPAALETFPLTEDQRRFKAATKAKNSPSVGLPELTDLFKF